MTVTITTTAPWIASQAADLVNNYAKTEGWDAIDVAESDYDAEERYEDALDEETGDQDMLEFVEEHGQDGYDALLGAFHAYVDACVEIAGGAVA